MNTKLVWIIIALSAIILLTTLSSKFLVDKIADRVIEKLQKDYSPSPYSPGFNPDSLDIGKIIKK